MLTQKGSTNFMILQPEQTVFAQSGVMVGKTLVDLQGEHVPVRLATESL